MTAEQPTAIEAAWRAYRRAVRIMPAAAVLEAWKALTLALEAAFPTGADDTPFMRDQGNDDA